MKSFGELPRIISSLLPLFAYRKVHTWPPKIEKGENWDEVYRAQSKDLDVLPTVNEAIDWVKDLVGKIDKA